MVPYIELSTKEASTSFVENKHVKTSRQVLIKENKKHLIFIIYFKNKKKK